MAEKKTVSIQELAPLIAEKIREGAAVELTVTGDSMKPTLTDRVSKVRLNKPVNLKIGDMVLYRRDNGVYVLHRIIGLDENGTFVLCGDT